MMLPATLLLGLVWMAVAEEPRQLLVMAGDDVASCRPRPEGWDSARPFRRAVPELVRQDLGAYFSGLSVQVTPILQAAWHGTVRFCTHEEEALVLQALVEWVVRPPGADEQPGVRLPVGADKLLTALASPALGEKLEAVEPTDDDETLRRATATGIVREAMGEPGPERERAIDPRS